MIKVFEWKEYYKIKNVKTNIASQVSKSGYKFLKIIQCLHYALFQCIIQIALLWHNFTLSCIKGVVIKRDVSALFQQNRGKKTPALIAYHRKNAQKNNFDLGSKHNPCTEVFQWQALKNKKINITKMILKRLSTVKTSH